VATVRGRSRQLGTLLRLIVPMLALLFTREPALAQPTVGSLACPVLALGAIAAFAETTGALTPATQSDVPDTAVLNRLAPLAGRNVLRVRGAFGEFTGHVAKIDLNGLEGFHPDSRFHDGGAPVEPLTWSQVTSIERYGTQSRRYAGIGAVVVGVSVGVLTAAAGVLYGNNTHEAAGLFLLGASYGALLGAGAGALVGMNFHQWHPEYPKRGH
jgi:hypothetical protein